MDISNIYDYLDEHYAIRKGTNAYQLYKGTCPLCGTTSGDLRLYCKSEREFQDIADSSDEDMLFFFFASCHHCGDPINFFHFASSLDDMTIHQAKEYLGNNDGFVRTKNEEDDKDYGMPFPEMERISGEELSEIFKNISDKKKIYSEDFCNKLIKRYNILQSTSDFEYKDRVFYCYNRIIFPLWDRQGALIGFQARATGESKAKYLMAPYVNKSQILYGSHLVPKKVDKLALCEGVTDCFAYCNIGIHSVASFGKTLTETQVQILLDINPGVLYIGWDRDAIGKSFEFCEKYGHRFNDIKIITLPNNVDADEMHGDELQIKVEESVSYSWDSMIINSMGVL